MEVAPDTAVVMASHDGERFLAHQIESILGQSLLPAMLTIVDDASRDGTRAVVREFARAAPVPIELIAIDGSFHHDYKTRVAAMVMRGLESVAAFEYALLSDQDDEWLPDRLSSQRAILQSQPNGLLVAGDGLLIDSDGVPIGGSLRDRFPPPPDWDRLDAAHRVRAAIRRPFVTGATCALRRQLVRLMAPLPARWLVDRWATLVAASQNGLVLQPDTVIRYRIHPGQLLGDRQASTGSGDRRWRQVLDRGASPVEAAKLARDVVGRIRPLAMDPAIRNELSWRAMARAAVERPASEVSRTS
jgi:glycosyltransferase involved in cell wall biosynthesis